MECTPNCSCTRLNWRSTSHEKPISVRNYLFTLIQRRGWIEQMVLNGLWRRCNPRNRWLKSWAIWIWAVIYGWWRCLLSSTLFGILPDTALHPCNCCKLMEEREPIMIRLIAEPRGPTFTTVKDWLTAPIYKSYPSFPYVIYPHNLRCITNLSRFKSHLLFIYWSFIWQTKYK